MGGIIADGAARHRARTTRARDPPSAMPEHILVATALSGRNGASPMKPDKATVALRSIASNLT
jgi:hypothetical protein